MNGRFICDMGRRSGEIRALSPASWFSRNEQPNERTAVDPNMFLRTKNGI